MGRPKKKKSEKVEKVRRGIKKGTPDEGKRGGVRWAEAAKKANRGENLTEAEKKMLFPNERWHTLNKYRHMWVAAPKIIQALKHGSSLDMAALFGGVDPKVLKEWMAKGVAKPKSYWGEFLKRIRVALAESDMMDLEALSKAVKSGEWEAAVARLKLRGFGDSKKNQSPVEVRIINFSGDKKEIEDKPPMRTIDGEEVRDEIEDKVSIKQIGDNSAEREESQ